VPAIVIGADSPIGEAIVAALGPDTREVRAFVSDPVAGAAFRGAGVKVALGDVSDSSHLAAAASGAFSAIVIARAAVDERERAFADDAATTVAGWIDGLREAGVRRVIWVEDDQVPLPQGRVAAIVPEWASVRATGRPDREVGQHVAALDDLASLG
jgi:nucleoside-diphosphate-sugar epimerase